MFSVSIWVLNSFETGKNKLQVEQHLNKKAWSTDSGIEGNAMTPLLNVLTVSALDVFSGIRSVRSPTSASSSKMELNNHSGHKVSCAHLCTFAIPDCKVLRPVSPSSFVNFLSSSERTAKLFASLCKISLHLDKSVGDCDKAATSSIFSAKEAAFFSKTLLTATPLYVDRSFCQCFLPTSKKIQTTANPVKEWKHTKDFSQTEIKSLKMCFYNYNLLKLESAVRKRHWYLRHSVPFCPAISLSILDNIHGKGQNSHGHDWWITCQIVTLSIWISADANFAVSPSVCCLLFTSQVKPAAFRQSETKCQLWHNQALRQSKSKQHHWQTSGVGHGNIWHGPGLGPKPIQNIR